jgi:hypothetical protein
MRHGVQFSCSAGNEGTTQYELAPAGAFPAARVHVLSVARETGKAQNRNTRAARNERRFSLILPGHDFQHTNQPIMSHGCPAPAQLALTSAQRLRHRDDLVYRAHFLVCFITCRPARGPSLGTSEGRPDPAGSRPVVLVRRGASRSSRSRNRRNQNDRKIL